jgi:hypothetical protein
MEPVFHSPAKVLPSDLRRNEPPRPQRKGLLGRMKALSCAPKVPPLYEGIASRRQGMLPLPKASPKAPTFKCPTLMGLSVTGLPANGRAT